MVSDNEAKLRTVLNYWIEHNQEHSKEFGDWAAKAREFGELDIAEEILLAAKELDKASGLLLKALERLDTKGK